MSGLDKFSFGIPANLRFGCGVMDELQKASLPGKRIMIVTGGRTIRKNGTVDRLMKMVRNKAEDIVLYDEVNVNQLCRKPIHLQSYAISEQQNTNS